MDDRGAGFQMDGDADFEEDSWFLEACVLKARGAGSSLVNSKESEEDSSALLTPDL